MGQGSDQHAGAHPAERVAARSVEDAVAQIRDYAIISLDPQGIIESWNLGAERAKGYTAEEAIGRSFAMFYVDEDRRRGLPMELLAAARDEGRVAHQGWRIRKDGTRFWGDVLITALHDAEGRLTGYVKVTRDLTEQHELAEQLRASEERLRLLVGQVVDYAIIALDPQGTIESWNLGAQRLKGYTAEEAVGHNFAMFYTDGDRRDGIPLRLLTEARDQGRVEHSGWRVRKDGTRFWGDVIITALHDDDGRLTGYAKVTRDRTDVKVLEDAQDAFYASFTHDFRTPVAALMGYVDALRDAGDDERDDLVDRVETNAQRLLDMVEGLVDFASQRATHASLLMDDIDVAQVARNAVHDLPPHLHPSRVSVAADAVVLGLANGVALHRVITNLLVNALKYAPGESPVEVTFGHSGRQVTVVVADQGRGIAEEDIASIFEEFTRGRLAQPDGGTGLGLASVRELVEQMRGRVSLTSELGVGTTVVVELPASPMASADARAQASWPSEGEDTAGQPAG